MKFLFLLLVLVGLFIVIPSKSADGLCLENEDWPDAPCWSKRCADNDAPACTDPSWWQEKWSPYYDYKGKEWMEVKKKELFNAIETNSVEEWKRFTPNGSNSNVFDYYFYMGEIPNSEGIFVKDIFPASSSIDLSIIVLVLILAIGGIGFTIYWIKKRQ